MENHLPDGCGVEATRCRLPATVDTHSACVGDHKARVIGRNLRLRLTWKTLRTDTFRCPPDLLCPCVHGKPGTVCRSTLLKDEREKPFESGRLPGYPTAIQSVPSVFETLTDQTRNRVNAIRVQFAIVDEAEFFPEPSVAGCLDRRSVRSACLRGPRILPTQSQTVRISRNGTVQLSADCTVAIATATG